MHPEQTLFISDLHLDPTRPEITQLFLRFLRSEATQATALYILGDLFEVWLGDDDLSEHNLLVINAMRALTDSGVKVYLMRGNRDFLMGERLASMSGCRLLEDPTRIELYGTPTLLMHGDLLCTDDHKYIEFRNRVRTREWQDDFLAKSLQQRSDMVRGLRQESRDETAEKPLYIMDVNQDAVRETMHNHQVQQLIHGHTHRPGTHTLKPDPQPATRMVLGDWHESGSVLRCNRNGCQLELFS